jgi:O-antigen ligase
LSVIIARRPPFSSATALCGLLAVTGGLTILLLPLRSSMALLAGAIMVPLAVWQPALGLGAALVLGPTRAYLAALGYSGPVYDLGQMFFGLALAGWLLRGALKREITLPRRGLLLPLGVFVFIGLWSLYNAVEWRDGINEAIKWIEVMATLVIAQSEARRGRAAWLVGALLLSGLIQAGLGLWQYEWRGTGPIGFRMPDGHYRAYGTFEQPNPFGGYMGLLWPVSAGLTWAAFGQAWRQRHFRAWAAAGMAAGVTLGLLLGLYVSYSRGAWLGAAAAALAMLVFLPRRMGLGAGLTLLALAAGLGLLQAGLLPASVTARLAEVPEFLAVRDVRGVNINDANFAIVERLAHWQAARAMIQSHPWLGVGLGNYVSAYAQYSLLNWPNALGHAHNIYLHMWAETGALGLLAYLGIWVTAIGQSVRLLRRGAGLPRGVALGLLGVWTHLLVHQAFDNLHVNNMDLLIGTYFGLLCAESSAGDLGRSAPDR